MTRDFDQLTIILTSLGTQDFDQLTRILLSLVTQDFDQLTSIRLCFHDGDIGPWRRIVRIWPGPWNLLESWMATANCPSPPDRRECDRCHKRPFAFLSMAKRCIWIRSPQNPETPGNFLPQQFRSKPAEGRSAKTFSGKSRMKNQNENFGLLSLPILFLNFRYLVSNFDPGQQIDRFRNFYFSLRIAFDYIWKLGWVGLGRARLGWVGMGQGEPSWVELGWAELGWAELN